jgi:hypothetical protein
MLRHVADHKEMEIVLAWMEVRCGRSSSRPEALRERREPHQCRRKLKARGLNLTSGFETWVLKKFEGQGRVMSGAPENWDKDKEFFYKIDDIQYRIKFADVPKRFL